MIEPLLPTKVRGKHGLDGPAGLNGTFCAVWTGPKKPAGFSMAGFFLVVERLVAGADRAEDLSIWRAFVDVETEFET